MSKTNFPRYSRQDELKNSPNLALVRLFCTSRGLKWLKRLKTPPPARACMRFSPKGGVTGRVTCRSNEEKRGKRWAFRGPTHSRSSVSTEKGNPVCKAHTERTVSLTGTAKIPQTRERV